METRKAKDLELRVRLRRIKPSEVSSMAAFDMRKTKTSSNSSESESDECATVHYSTAKVKASQQQCTGAVPRQQSPHSCDGAAALPREMGKRSSLDVNCYSSSEEDFFELNDVLTICDEAVEPSGVHIMQLLRLYAMAGSNPPVVADNDPSAALKKILSRASFDPHAPKLQVQMIIKAAVSSAQLSLRENSENEVEIKKGKMLDYVKRSSLSSFLDFPNIPVKHDKDEFFTFCSCKSCTGYREVITHIMMEQFKASHMVVMLLDVLIKAYGPMLKNITAYNRFEKLLDANKQTYWIAGGTIYNKKTMHMNFVYDEALSDNMIYVLFSSILMVNNPMLLLQILSFHVENIVKAYADGFLEIVDPGDKKIPAVEMLTYVLDGYDDLCRISEKISTYLFAFENDFLRNFSLTWTLLCQRLYQLHVYSNLADTMLACIITLKEDELISRHAELIRKYIQFDDKMNSVEKHWAHVWIELNNFNTMDTERKRRQCLLDIHRLFAAVVQDATAFRLQEVGDDIDFWGFPTPQNRRLAWQNLMAYTKMKWPDGFFEQPNTLVREDKCRICNFRLEYHLELCKCITCSIAGGPLPPRRDPDGTCYRCLAAQSRVEKEGNLYESEILNVCSSDDLTSVKSNGKRKSTTLEELNEELSTLLPAAEACIDGDGEYHVGWAIFHRIKTRKPYRHASIEEKYFCVDCKQPACLLARKILNNELSKSFAQHLVRHYEILQLTREDLRSILPNITLYNRKMVASNAAPDLTDVHDLVVKIYWTFITTLYANYFIKFNENCPLNLDNLQIANNDIQICIEKLNDNLNDDDFFEFLTKMESFDYGVDVEAEELHTKLDKFLNISEKNQDIMSIDRNPPPSESSTEKSTASECYQKKNHKDKQKKCCFDHSDLGDHCKETFSKKRIKKECNHARMNETRDRLRKKLSQLINARKNIKTANACEQSIQSQPLPTNKQPPSLKSVATAAAAASSKSVYTKSEDNDDSLECLSTLCKRISHLHSAKANATSSLAAANCSKKLIATQNAGLRKHTASSVLKETRNNLSPIAKTIDNLHVNNVATTIHNNSNIQKTAPTPEKRTSVSIAGIDETVVSATSREATRLDMVSEIYEFLDNYSKDQSKVKKWINQTLSYIEGSSSSANGKKQHPQPTNPKKAAKKAKQKQRREEEKRITELHDLRGQFHDIYFKEFTDKLNLKALKSNKKRDKKKISELEVNVKKLQRAKAKVESSILEQIATVKQTNLEFKFAYLPTKEQQLAKMRALESHATGNEAPATNAASNVNSTQPLASDLETNSMAGNNNFNAGNIVAGNYSIPYMHANHFPYHIDFQSPTSTPLPPAIAGTSYGMIRPPLPATPVCYSPPQQQQLSPDVVAAMAANANSDPSKRIVTIRRVNLPNVPEPQVTVTAKGSSPDKDKLLYTFVNGQLVQTSSATPPMTQLPLCQPLNTLPMQQLQNVTEHLIPIPPPPQLSKTQMKKERKRLTKRAAEEAQASAALKAVEAERRLQAEVEQHLRQQQRAKEALATQVKSKTNAKVKQCPQLKAAPQVADTVLAVKTKKKKNQNVAPLASVVTTTNTAATVKSAKTKGNLNRSGSITTSCSGATSLSATPISSEVNTRDNSVASLKPVPPVINNAKTKTKQLQQTKSNLQQVQSQQQQQTLQQKNKLPQKQQPQVAPPKQPTQTLTIKTKTKEPAAEIPLTAAKCDQIKKPRSKQPKFVDSGQFDNNPFKSLHMQDSESEWDSSSSYEQLSAAEEQEEKRAACLKLKAPQQLAKKEILPKNQTKKAQAAAEVNNSVKEESNQKTKSRRKQVENESYKKVAPTNAVITKSETQQTRQSNKVTTKTQQPAERSAKQALQKETCNSKSSQQNRNSKSERQHANQNSSHKSNTLLAPNMSKSNSASSSFMPHNTPINTTQQQHNAVRNTNNRRQTEVASQLKASAEDKPLSKRAQKQAQRNKKFQKRQQQQPYEDCCAGIPEHMDYFNPNDVLIPTTNTPNITNAMHSQTIAQNQQQHQHQHQQHQHQQQQQHQYNNLAHQMQNLHIANSAMHQPSYASVSTNYQQMCATNKTNTNMPNSNKLNNDIMDQLNRGVQVENLSLPPGITLTKVDPAKSEELRQKSESIQKLSKPLQATHTQHTGVPTQAFHHHHPGATIIAPPVSSIPNYYGVAAPYANVTADQSGIIMVEANTSSARTTHTKPTKLNIAAAAAAAAVQSGKTSKNKKRRNKSKQNGTITTPARTDHNPQTADTVNQSNMVTLRNPMFHSGAAGAAATILQQQQPLMPGRSIGGISLPTPLPADQPAAIIKNDNGMFTIRNPALHQAVTNGLALGGYRQFSNVNYYTPQEAAAEAAKAIQQNAVTANKMSATGTNTSSFSYFSNTPNNKHMTSTAVSSSVVSAGSVAGIARTVDAGASPKNTHNTISISCTSISGNGSTGLTGDAAVIARPTPQQKCLSAIGSEVKSAQQLKQQKSKEHQWKNYGQDISVDNLACGSSYLAGGSTAGNSGSANLQDKYQQSSYYNGFDVFPAQSSNSQISSTSTTGGRSSTTGSLFDSSDSHMHHSCDDSPPPTITSFPSYLDALPNTGVIRYDDASFLKNLIPGQNLNNEVSIHNVNDTNFTRNSASPVAHRVEITPVYANRPTSTNIYEHCAKATAQQQQQQQQHQQQNEQHQSFLNNSATSYSENLRDYGSDSNVFSSSNLINLNELDSRGAGAGGTDVKSFNKRFNYDFDTAATQAENQQVTLNDLLMKKSSHSHRTSPYVDEAAVDNFVVHNMNTLQIAEAADEQLNSSGIANVSISGGGGVNDSNGSIAGGTNNSANNSNTSNGWW